VFDLGFRQRLWLPLLAGLLALMLISVLDAYHAREIRIEERRRNLVSVTTMAVNLVRQYGDLAKTGALTEDEAKKQALDRLRALRYDKEKWLPPRLPFRPRNANASVHFRIHRQGRF
jgi:methyl-accepting chemotaxis protein